MAAADLPRYDSVDALRGIAVAAMLLACHPGDPHRLHAPQPAADLVYPFFLFVAGVSIALARERLTDGAVLARALRIVGLGLVLHALAYLILDRPEYRIPGVLQRVGLCYAIAALLAIHTRRGAQWIAIGAILVGYWAWMGWGEPYTHENRPDPEGLSTTLPAVATTLLGVRAGDWLRANALKRIAGAGIALLLAAELWAPAFAFDRALWTSSFVLWSAGWAMLALAALDAAIDLRRWPAFGRRLGRNAAAIYAGGFLMGVLLEASRWRSAFEGAIAGWLVSPAAPALAYGLAWVLLAWTVAAWMDRRDIRVTL
jgi:predicted acyltransferase